jgi:ADP-ribose pyrophosphatase
MQTDPVTVLKKEHLIKGRIFDLERHVLSFPNGYKLPMEIVRHPGASAVVPLLGESTLLMVRQYRYAVGDYILEIPAGTLKKGEDPEECARRELEEETGYRAGRFLKLGKIYPLPGYSDETIHIYLATELKKAGQRLDQDEIINLEPVDLTMAYEMVRAGRILDAKSICGLFMVKSFLGSRGV